MKKNNKMNKKTKKSPKRDNERLEIIIRLVVLIVTGIILEIWGYLIFVLALLHWIMTLITGKRYKDIAEFSEYWNSELYRYFRYITLVSNERPFPFDALKKSGKFT